MVVCRGGTNISYKFFLAAGGGKAAVHAVPTDVYHQEGLGFMQLGWPLCDEKMGQRFGLRDIVDLVGLHLKSRLSGYCLLDDGSINILEDLGELRRDWQNDAVDDEIVAGTDRIDICGNVAEEYDQRLVELLLKSNLMSVLHQNLKLRVVAQGRVVGEEIHVVLQRTAIDVVEGVTADMVFPIGMERVPIGRVLVQADPRVILKNEVLCRRRYCQIAVLEDKMPLSRSDHSASEGAAEVNTEDAVDSCQ